jgi:hypothetical protein
MLSDMVCFPLTFQTPQARIRMSTSCFEIYRPINRMSTSNL